MAKNKRTASLILVCEDRQQEAFARRYFESRGFHARRIRVLRNPKGQGAGEQFVRQTFITEVQVHRQRISYQPIGTTLVVLIDADLLSVAARVRQLNDGLEANGQTRIQPQEKIAIFVPKRNIETWIHYGRGRSVDEETVYPKLDRPRSCKDAVHNYVTDICANSLPDDAPASLNHACTELGRIL